MQYDLCLIVNLHPKQHYKHLHPIYFKHARISQLPDFIAIQQLHSSRTLVEVIAERNATVPRLDFPERVHSLMSTGSGDWNIRLSVVMWIAWGISQKCCCKSG